MNVDQVVQNIVAITGDHVLKGGTCTGDGPCDTSEFSESTTDNWVARTEGLPDYIRAVAHALARDGMGEQEAIATAVATMHRWANGEDHVTQATRERARGALAEWDAKRAEAHASHKTPEASVTKSRRNLTTTYVDFAIEKAEKQPDGSLLVWGPCTTDDVDSDRQIIDPEFASGGLSKWLATGGNVREMHQPKAIGLGIELVRQDNQHWLRSKIVEPTAVRLAEEGVLRAYSVGISNAKIDYAKNPKARGGTIVGGEFVEVSLVDRPANAACKVDIVKSADDGTAVWTDVLTKVSESEGETEAAEDAEITKLWTAEGAVYKKDYSAEERRKLAKEGKALPDGSYPIADAEDLKNAAILAQSGHGDVAAAKRLIARRAKELGVANPLKKTDKGVPAVDEEVTEDLEHADAAVHEAQHAQAQDNDAHEHGETDKAVFPYALKRLHDHLCAAYAVEDVVAEYPTCTTIKDAVDVSYWAKAVSTALAEDAGSGKLASTLADLAATYGAAIQVLHADPAALNDARADLHKAFSDMYPSVTVKPSAVTPGRFCRPFIRSGRALMHASGHPRLPMQAHTPDASDFERGYITDHRAANSPSAGAPNGPRSEKGKKANKRQFYTNNAKDQATEAMTVLHDYIAAFHPEVCAMKLEADEPAPNDGGRVPNSADAHPAPVATKAEQVDQPEAGQTAELTKIQKAVNKLAKQNKKLAKKYQTTKKALRDMEMQADPGAMAYRGGYIGQTVTKAVTEPVDPEETARNEEVTRLKGQVRGTDPVFARQAIEKLRTMVTSDELAEILTNS